MNEVDKKVFQPLYGIDIKNKIKEWKISVTNMGGYSTMVYSYGYINGKKVECSQNIDKGKNLGKKNATTHYEQAISNAKSKWNQKIDEGYSIDFNSIENKLKCSVDIEVIETVLAETVLVETVFPMLAQDYFKHKSKLQWPCFIQPKLDGYRMIYNNLDKSCMSRQGKSFDIIKQTLLYTELQNLFPQSNNLILDGELYLHGGVFEHLGILRKKKLTNNDIEKLQQIEYHVYDIVDKSKSFKQRYEFLKNMLSEKKVTKIKLVQTFEIKNEKELECKHKRFIDDNYEGSILRNTNGKYKCKARSCDLLKYKDFEDAEFPIIDYTFEIDTTETNKNLVVWICETPNKTSFNIRPKGTKEERQQLFKECEENFDKYKGRNLYVKYFELTENNVPRFPTTKTNSYTSYIRDIVE